MSDRDVEDVRRELASEREGLSADVDDLREGSSKLKSKLPLVVGGALASLVGLRALKRLLRRSPSG
jgi:hypothetical protein